MNKNTLPEIEQPDPPHAIAFVDGQNLFHCAREAFGYTYPNYDPKKLAESVCQIQGWRLTQVRFYTGVPKRDRDAKWHSFWSSKARFMSRQQVHVVTRPLRYVGELLEDGRYQYISREKGIDVRLAIDVLRLTYAKSLDVALLFSQDNDLSELAIEIRDLAQRQNRWIRIASAYPVGPGTKNPRGIDRTDWIKIDAGLYNKCLDDRNHFPSAAPMD